MNWWISLVLLIPADVDLEGEFKDLARPSFIGSAELTFFRCVAFRSNMLNGD